MNSSGSITRILKDIRDLDEFAFEQLHRKIWPMLLSIARNRARGVPLGHSDEEDIAQEAFLGFHQAIVNDKVPQLDNRNDLMALLSTIIACRVFSEQKRVLAMRRDQRRTTNLNAIEALLEHDKDDPMQAAILNDSYEFYLNSLPDELREFARLHLAGLQNNEIASQLNCVERTVERKIARLRGYWQRLAERSTQEDVRTWTSQDSNS